MDEPITEACGCTFDIIPGVRVWPARDRHLEVEALGGELVHRFEECSGVLVVLPSVRPDDARPLGPSEGCAVDECAVEGRCEHLRFRTEAFGYVARTMVREDPQERRNRLEERLEVVAAVEHALVGRERARDVHERVVVVPLGGVAHGIDELILVEVDDGRDVPEGITCERQQVAEVDEGAGEEHVPGAVMTRPGRLDPGGGLGPRAGAGLDLLGENDGGAAHAPLPLAGGQCDAIDHDAPGAEVSREAVEDRAVRTTIIGFDGEYPERRDAHLGAPGER